MQVGTTLETGSVLKGRFELQEVIGAGGMGTVYKALDRLAREAHDRDPYLAIKVLHAELVEDPTFFVAMQREAKKAKSLAHPNIVAVYDFDRDGPHIFLSMEFLQGRPLNDVIREHPKGMSFGQAWPIIQGMAAALMHAHGHGIVHSDFKPGNVFLDHRNGVKVLDFGIACPFDRGDARDSDATVFHARSLNALSPAYASLEMLEGLRPDPRDDVYALACVTYELLSGRHPFARSSARQALELKVEPAPLPALGRKQWRGLAQALALAREKRTRTVEQFLAALAPAPATGLGRIAGYVFLALGGMSALAWLAAERWGGTAPEPATAEAPPAGVGGTGVPAPSPPDVATLAPEEPATAKPGAGRTPAPEPLKLSLSAPGYRIGEAMVLFVETARPLYLTLVHVSADGQVSTIFPNPYQSDNRLEAGTKLRVPDEDAAYRLTVSGPPGTDRVEALGSDVPLPADAVLFDGRGELVPLWQERISSRVRVEIPVTP